MACRVYRDVKLGLLDDNGSENTYVFSYMPSSGLSTVRFGNSFPLVVIATSATGSSSQEEA